MNEITKTIKSIIIIGLIITVTAAFGAGINAFIPWEWLTYFFSIIRNTIGLIDFMVNTDVVLIIMGIWLNISIYYWLFLAGEWIWGRLKD